MLMRNGQSFLIMESEELSRLQWWLIVSVAIDLVGIAAIVTAFVLSIQDAVSDATLWTIIWITMGSLLLSLLTIGPFIFLTFKNRTRPVDEYGRLQDIWDRAA